MSPQESRPTSGFNKKGWLGHTFLWKPHSLRRSPQGIQEEKRPDHALFFVTISTAVRGRPASWLGGLAGGWAGAGGGRGVVGGGVCVSPLATADPPGVARARWQGSSGKRSGHGKFCFGPHFLIGRFRPLAKLC